jgi:3-oxoacyl-[acyl-carrier protein] reductase
VDLAISDRVALVMGASGGLGAAISASLAREGVLVAGAGSNIASLQVTKDALDAEGLRFFPTPLNLEDLGSIHRAVNAVEESLDRPVDILINNTGGPPPTTAAGVPTATWRKHFESMVLSVYHTTDLVLPGMRERGWGRIITSASSGVVAPIANLGISNALRSALVGWSKTLSNEVGPDGVTANVVVPGRIATDRIMRLDLLRAAREGRSAEEVRESSLASIPVGRYGRPQEYGDTVAFLASEAASFINGAVIRVDGGMIPSA